ncbi:hypothetical protein N7450_004611 [Penicillium hetheringtonii]|uniref:Uncharacterized protein n=1 Tax=Penicillium hetheringtonii TaxID=911720 RepID=A0AAD6GWH7_9EURO|nr:hypothetical protein N7450_004611 [Penicillium hetheringtonii]
MPDLISQLRSVIRNLAHVGNSGDINGSYTALTHICEILSIMLDSNPELSAGELDFIDETIDIMKDQIELVKDQPEVAHDAMVTSTKLLALLVDLMLKDRGGEIRPFDLSGPKEPLVEALRDIDVLISVIAATDQNAQIPLATATKKAQVKRFVPCAFITFVPLGRMMLRDWRMFITTSTAIHLPYTIIDVGWWYQIGYPRLPSGKIDYVAMDVPTLVGDGTVPSALTDLRIEVWMANRVVDELERLSGKKSPRKYLNEKTLRERVETAAEHYETDLNQAFLEVSAEYMLSWELYPDFQPISFVSYLQGVLDGKAKPVHEDSEAIRSLSSSLREALDGKV